MMQEHDNKITHHIACYKAIHVSPFTFSAYFLSSSCISKTV